MGKVLHASASGYFPTCIVAGDPENCPWTLENAMNAYWRVRTWTFQADGMLLADEEGQEPYPFSVTIGGITSTDIDGIPHTLEESLVCFNSFIDNPFNMEIQFATPEESDDLYNSGLDGFAETEVDTGDIIEFGFSTKTSGEYSVSIFGQNIPMYAVTVEDEPEITTSVISATASLTPTLWWSYGGTYNTSTGERL